MLTYQFSKYIAAGILATFIGHGVPPPEATPEIPVETGSIVVPLGPRYRTHQWIQGIPPEELVLEIPPQVPVETGVLIVPLGIGYRGETFVRNAPPPAPPVLEADELTNKRRSIYTPIRPYAGKSFVVQPPIPALVVTEANELTVARRSIYTPPRPYAGKSFTAKAPPEEVIPPTIDSASQKARFVTVPIAGYNYLALAAYAKPDEIDELISSRRAQWIPPQPYRGQSFIGRHAPMPANVILEAPELTIQRQALVAPPFTYRGRSYTYALPPEVEEAEVEAVGPLTIDIRYARRSPYRAHTYTFALQPTEIDELLQGRRTIILAPPLPYAGKTVIVLPQTLGVFEAIELQSATRRIYTPIVPYAPNLVRITPIEVPEQIVNEANELTIGRVVINGKPYFYSTQLTRVNWYDLTLYEPPPTVLITGVADLRLTDFLIAPIRTPLPVKKLGNIPVIVVKDVHAWSRWFAEVTKRFQDQRHLTVTLDFPPTGPLGYNDAQVTAIGVVPGDAVSLAVPANVVLPNTTYFGFVSAENQITIRFNNNHPTLDQDPPAGEFGIIVQKV